MYSAYIYNTYYSIIRVVATVDGIGSLIVPIYEHGMGVKSFNTQKTAERRLHRPKQI